MKLCEKCGSINKINNIESMGKTFKRNEQFRPKKQGQVFTKDQSWKKNKKKPSVIIDYKSMNENNETET